jgi:hypothetical protein
MDSARGTWSVGLGQCSVLASLDNAIALPRRTWNLAYWKLWKDAFFEVSRMKDDTRVSTEARTASLRAYEATARLEIDREDSGNK